MKNYKFCRITLWLLVLLFVKINANVLNPLPIPTYRQIGTNTCWSACLHMILIHYHQHVSEEEIHMRAFGAWRDIPNKMWGPSNSTIRLLANYLSGDTIRYHVKSYGLVDILGEAPLTPRQIIAEINNNKPILAGWAGPDTTSIGHMVVIIGYIGSANMGDSMEITYNDPLDDFIPFDEYFVRFRDRPSPDTSLRWTEAISIANSPQTVGEGGVFPTIQSAVNSSRPGMAIFVIDRRTFNEQVIINRPGTRSTPIRSTLGHPRPVMEYYSTIPPFPSPQNYAGFNVSGVVPLSSGSIDANSVLRIHGGTHTHVSIDGIDIKGGNAIYNTGSLTLSNSDVSATSGYAVYNTGILYVWGGSAVSSTSGSAIYSTSFVQTGHDATISAASGYAIHHAGNTGSVGILNNTVINVASINDTAIYNSGSESVLLLGNDPAINGRIAGFRAGKIRVHTGGLLSFAPSNGRKYILSPHDLKDGDTVVVNGASFVNNFELTDDRFVLEAVGNNLVARIPMEKKFADVKSGDTITIPPGVHNLNNCAAVPDSAQNVVLLLQPGTEIRFTGDAREIWVGTTGSIIGAENVKISPQVILYNTPTPREPLLPQDRVIGLFSNLCDAIWRGQGGRTIKVGPGIYNFSSIGGQGLIGVMHHERAKSSILRFGFNDSPPGCERNSYGAVTLIRGMRLEMNGDHYVEGYPFNPVLTTSGGGVAIFENCVYEALYSDPARKEVIAHQLGAAGHYFGGRTEFRNSVFRNFDTAILVNDPMLAERSPVFTNSIFADNNTDLRFRDGSLALCGTEANQIGSVQVGYTRYIGEAEINTLVSGVCASAGITTRPNMSAANPGFVDPLISDYRLSSNSPLIGTGIGLEDMGREMIFTFSSFLNGRIDFGQGRRVEFVNGVITDNRTGGPVSLRFTYTLDLRPVYELRVGGSFINASSEVTVWRRSDNVLMPVLPDEYAVWDVSVNGVSFVEMSYGEFYPLSLRGNGRVSKNVVPNTAAPAPVSGVNAVDEGGDVVLSWSRSAELDVARYKVFRAPVSAQHQVTQIASLPADVTEFRDVDRQMAGNVYSIVAYDSTGNMSVPSGGNSLINNNKVYSFSGFDGHIRDTVRVTPSGVTVQINNADYLHGAMITVRNRGHNDSLVVEWVGVRDQNHRDCESRVAQLFGNGAQINNIASPKLGNGSVMFNLRSATNKTYLVDVEIYNWRNGQGCR